MDKNTRVRLPKGVKQLEAPEEAGRWVGYQFPGECEVRTEPVSRSELGLVIALAVLGICLWGTLMGALMPR